MRSREVIAKIQSLGGKPTRQNGSHRRFDAASHDGTTVRTTVQVHPGRDIPKGTLRAIERDLEPAFGKGWLR